MKRAAAFLGPTPAFLRWTLAYSCPLRELDTADLSSKREPGAKSLPAQTFRQLRSLRELSLATTEGRVVDGVAVHEAVDVDSPLLGFITNEVESAFGGLEHIQSCCPPCPANVAKAIDTAAGASSFAGCFGVVRLDAMDRWIRLVAERMSVGFAERLRQCQIPLTNPQWYGLWVDPVLGQEQAACLLDLLGGRVETSSDSEPPVSSEWLHLLAALQKSAELDIPMHVELYPSGQSDGVHWTLDPHCCRCKALQEKESAGAKCLTCGEVNATVSTKKRKVLGLRPYMKMEQVLGAEKCAAIKKKYLEG